MLKILEAVTIFDQKCVQEYLWTFSLEQELIYSISSWFLVALYDIGYKCITSKKHNDFVGSSNL